MSTLSLIMASVLLIIPLVISYHEKIGMEKEIIVSVGRAVVQLLIVGYFLDLIFGLDNPLVVVVLVLIMVVNGARNAEKRGKGIKNGFKISFIALGTGTVVTLTMLVVVGAIEFTPDQVIPVAGMIVSNAMIAIGLSYKHLQSSFREKQGEIEVKLSLGANTKLASQEIIRESIRTAIIPTVDSAKTLGLVALPGMMTGLILGGTSPIIAVKFQIMVTFMVLASSSIAAMVATYWAYPSFYNQRKQLKI